MTRKKVWISCALVALLLTFGPGVVVLGWALVTSNVSEDARRASCHNNLTIVSMTIQMFENENGRLPKNLSELATSTFRDGEPVVQNHRVFLCPSVRTGPGDPNQTDAWSSYRFEPGPPGERTFILREKAFNHIFVTDELQEGKTRGEQEVVTTGSRYKYRVRNIHYSNGHDSRNTTEFGERIE